MIDREEFARIRQELDEDDKIREDIISRSRQVIKDSKVIIYSLHRGDMAKAEEFLGEIKKKVHALPEADIHVGIKNTAYQEYVEALALYVFVKEGRLVTLRESGVERTQYLLGVCDLTGELMRMAVNSTISGDYDRVQSIRQMVYDIYGEFLLMDLPNSELRKKSDSIKWNLNKIDEVLYNIKLKG